MAFEYDDGNITPVFLGGVNKETGKKNPTEFTGYFSHETTMTTKFGVKPYFVFKTDKGSFGILGSGNLTKILRSKVPGLLTHIIDTGTTKDVGKGNAMKVFKVGQDASDSIDAAAVSNYQTATSDNVSYDDTDDTDLDADDAPVTPPAPRAAAPRQPAQVGADAVAKARELAARLRK